MRTVTLALICLVASTQVLIETMQRCRTGDNRLRARLPEGVMVADKTGTLGGSVNDFYLFAKQP